MLLVINTVADAGYTRKSVAAKAARELCAQLPTTSQPLTSAQAGHAAKLEQNTTSRQIRECHTTTQYIQCKGTAQHGTAQLLNLP